MATELPDRNNLWPPKIIPSLDGIRAISILMVLASHCAGTKGFPTTFPEWVTGHGALGVQIFFVISGFLITTLLLEEQTKTGRVDLKLFYIRRTLRIFPAFLVFMGVTLAMVAFGRVIISPSNLIHALTYTMNYTQSGEWWTGHLWSLSVEEQFYLAWPAVFFLARQRVAAGITAFVSVGAPLFLGGLHWARHPLAGPMSMWFPFVADSIACGCLLAIWLPSQRKKVWFQRTITSPIGLIVPIFILVLDSLTHGHPRLRLPLGQWMINVGIAYSIARFVLYPDDMVGRALNSRPARIIGILSYSLYLWQQPFLNRFSIAVWTTFPYNIIGAVCCAVTSYLLVEKPLMKFRRRFQPTATPVTVRT